MEVMTQRRRSLVWGLLLLGVLAAGLPVPVVAQEGEPSPILVKLSAPSEAGPGSAITLAIQYDAVDLNAGADLNYNLFGPGHVVQRTPEPPNPSANTWIPGSGNAQGTITIRIQIDEGTDGQTIQHEVEVRWGGKVRKFRAQTSIKYVPPTVTPTPTPRPAPRATPTPQPSPTASEPAVPTLELLEVSLLDVNGTALRSARTNQAIVVRADYVSTGDLDDVLVTVRFEPDVVNLDLQRKDGEYSLVLPSLPAAADGALLFEPPVLGRIRPYVRGDRVYDLRAIVHVEPSEEGSLLLTATLSSEPIEITQDLQLTVEAHVDAEVVRAGGNIIVHTTCENRGVVPVRGLRLELGPLPASFAVTPQEQIIDQIPQGGGAEERLFTVHTSPDFTGPVDFKLVAMVGETIVESRPLRVEVSVPVPLDLQASVSDSTAYAGQSIHLTVRCRNGGQLSAQGITAKLIDTAGNLGVLLQKVDDLGPGEDRELVFVVDVPRDFPLDTMSSLVVQTISEDGTTSQSDPVAVSVVCVPQIEVIVQVPAGQLQAGQSMEAIVTVRNVSQCAARDVLVALDGLPGGFALPRAQKIVELQPGGTRHLTFNVLIPQRFLGSGSFAAQVSLGGGDQVRSSLTTFSVSTVSVWFTIAFGALVVLAVTAIVVGVVLYFRHR